MSAQPPGSEQQDHRNPPPTRALDRDGVLPVAMELWAQAGAQHWISVEGGSMTPLLREGDAVLVACGRDQVQRGDVALFRQKGKLVAHRVLSVIQDDGGPTLVTKGDSLRTVDAPVPAERIVGRVVAIERRGRRIRLDSPGWRVAGWLIAVTTLCAAVPYRWGRAFLRSLRAGQRSRPEQ